MTGTSSGNHHDAATCTAITVKDYNPVYQDYSLFVMLSFCGKYAGFLFTV